MQVFPFLALGILPRGAVLRIGHDVQPLDGGLFQHRVPRHPGGTRGDVYVVDPSPAVSKVARTFAMFATISFLLAFGNFRARRFEEVRESSR